LATSFLLIEEYFATGDDRFVDAIRDFHIPGTLATIADKWRKDPRPWARDQIVRYLELPLDAAGHETVVKRLFKQAEEARDDGLMAAFATAFDRLVRRQRRTHYRYDWQTRQSWQEETLFSPRNALPTPSPSAKQGPVVFQFKPAAHSYRRGARVFSYHTRYYLRRRVWRYFRRLGYARPDEYAGGVAQFLRLYRDEDLARGEFILDSWSLIHACFADSDVLEFGAAVVRIREGRALRELTAAPDFPQLWQAPGAARVLIDLVFDARARLIRIWSIQLLRAAHADFLKAVPILDIRRLLDHADDEVQLLGVELLEHSTELDKLPVSAWIELLSVRSPMVLETICRLMSQHVRSERLDLSQCVQLACAKPTPVARLGYDFLQDQVVVGEKHFDLIAKLADAKCAIIGAKLAVFGLGMIGKRDWYRVDRVARFFDSLLREIRGEACAWLKSGSAGWDDSALWSRLVETPYDDVRLYLVRALQQRITVPGLGAESLSAVWSGVLLGIHRGGRSKLIALQQISRAVRDHPESAEILLPVMAVAIRSVRPAEARAGLGAIVSAVESRPELTGLLARVLPELELQPEGAAR
jgi:hypothetical protein